MQARQLSQHQVSALWNGHPPPQLVGAVSVTFSGVPRQVEYAGLAPGFVGLDQINVIVPRSLIGRGEVGVVLTVDGKMANTVKVSIK